MPTSRRRAAVGWPSPRTIGWCALSVPAHSPLAILLFACRCGRRSGEAGSADARMMPDLAVLAALCALAAVEVERATFAPCSPLPPIAGIPAYRDVFACSRLIRAGARGGPDLDLQRGEGNPSRPTRTATMSVTLPHSGSTPSSARSRERRGDRRLRPGGAGVRIWLVDRREVQRLDTVESGRATADDRSGVAFAPSWWSPTDGITCSPTPARCSSSVSAVALRHRSAAATAAGIWIAEVGTWSCRSIDPSTLEASILAVRWLAYLGQVRGVFTRMISRWHWVSCSRGLRRPVVGRGCPPRNVRSGPWRRPPHGR